MNKLFLTVCVVLVVGCGSDNPATPPVDGGSIDASQEVDAGHDLGPTEVDLGVQDDLGIADTDLGVEADASVMPDLGIESDLGIDLGTDDAGVLVDFGTDLGVPDLGTDAGPPPPHFTDLGGGIVCDNETGTAWEQAPPGGTFLCNRTQAGAAAYCAGLWTAGGGWRLPTQDELLSIVDTTRTYPSIDPVYFPGTPSDYFWSTTPVPGSPLWVWTVDFTNGTAHPMSPGVPNLCARCVKIYWPGCG